MAFTVAPTSGDAPYMLSADILGAGYIDGVHYGADIRTASRVGSCPFDAAGTLLPTNVVNALLANGSVILDDETVDAGSCKTFTLRIRNIDDNTAVSSTSTAVDNI